MDNQFTPEEQQLIERLQNAPRPQLRPAARDGIRDKIMRELHVPAKPAQPMIKSGLHFTPRLAAVVVAIIVAVLLTVLAIIQLTKPAPPDNTPTSAPAPTTAVLMASTATTGVIPENSTPNAETTPASTPEATAMITVTSPLPATAAPTLTMTPPATLEAAVVIEGPITNIENNIITIYDFEVELAPDHPFLNIVQVGDFVHIEGAFGNTGSIVASVVSNVTTATSVEAATVGLDGPVEAINGNVLVVNGIPAQLAPDDPLLQSVQVGDFVTLQGNFEGSGVNIILVVVNITVINNVVIDNNPLCWFHDNGMGMGHWHCDGMGMGMGDAMGMGEDGMGMGDAMGMGR